MFCQANGNNTIQAKVNYPNQPFSRVKQLSVTFCFQYNPPENVHRNYPVYNLLPLSLHY